MARLSHTVAQSEQERLRFTRWVLFLVNAAEASGIGRLNRKQLHLLLFMSFASSRFYGIQPLRQRARRTDQGPYYRAAHIALGGLALSGLVDVQEFRAHPSTVHLQFDGVFGATIQGMDVGRLLRSTHRGEELYGFLLDLCLAAVEGAWHEELGQTREERRGLESVFEQDLSYQQALGRPGNVLFIEESPGDESTPTLAGLRVIKSYLAEKTFANRRDVLSVYQRVLQKKAA
jgi:hypothetical protein